MVVWEKFVMELKNMDLFAPHAQQHACSFVRHTLVDKEFADYLRVRIIKSFCQVKCANRPAMHVFEEYVRDSILNTFLGNSPKNEFGGGGVDPFLNLSLFESGSAADSPDYRHHSYGTHVVR